MQSDRDLLKQALEALEYWVTVPDHSVILDLRERLAQPETEAEIYKRLYALRGKALERPCSRCGYQPKQIYPMGNPLDRMAENARELGLDYEPVQKEKPDGRQTTGPLTDRTDHVRNGDDYMPEPVGEIVQAFADLTAVSIPVMPPVGTKLYTTPPRREWVSVTEAEIKALPQWYPSHETAAVMPLIRAIEFKLRKRNA